MAEAPAAVTSSNGSAAHARPEPSDAGKQELARTLASKLAQGFEVESETETDVVLVMKGRRRWFGLSNTPSARFQISIGENGRATSRRL